jgi:hypothetical protein
MTFLLPGTTQATFIPGCDSTTARCDTGSKPSSFLQGPDVPTTQATVLRARQETARADRVWDSALESPRDECTRFMLLAFMHQHKALLALLDCGHGLMRHYLHHGLKDTGHLHKRLQEYEQTHRLADRITTNEANALRDPNTLSALLRFACLPCARPCVRVDLKITFNLTPLLSDAQVNYRVRVVEAGFDAKGRLCKIGYSVALPDKLAEPSAQQGWRRSPGVSRPLFIALGTDGGIKTMFIAPNKNDDGDFGATRSSMAAVRLVRTPEAALRLIDSTSLGLWRLKPRGAAALGPH